MSNLKQMKQKNKTGVEKPVFEPGKSYKWEPDTEFIITGNEFALLYKRLRENAEKANLDIQAFQILQRLLESGITDGNVFEMEEKQ